jgi:hypothetical protein
MNVFKKTSLALLNNLKGATHLFTYVVAMSPVFFHWIHLNGKIIVILLSFVFEVMLLLVPCQKIVL